MEVIHYHFDFLPVFKYAIARGLGENFGRISYNYLKENDTDVFTNEKKYFEGKKDKIIYVVNKYSDFKFLGSRVVFLTKDPTEYINIYQKHSIIFW